MTDVTRRLQLAQGALKPSPDNLTKEGIEKLDYDVLLKIAVEKGYDVNLGKKREQLVEYLNSTL